MTRTILLFKFIISTCFAIGQTVDCSKIKDRNGIDYIDDYKTPFSGICVQYHPNGKKSFEGQYKNGRTCGTCKWYYDNGQIEKQVQYILDKENWSRPDGKCIQWFPNGKVMEVVNYKQGLYEGEWYELDIKGKTIKNGLYKDNKLVSGDEYVMPEF